MSNKIIISNGYKYKKITSDLEFELALSSKSLAFCHKIGIIVCVHSYAELVDTYHWSDSTFKTATSLKGDWTMYVCIGEVENLGHTEEADTNSSDL